MQELKKALNRFLVDVFQDILKTEEHCLSKGAYRNLSIHEMHVIEAVLQGEADNSNAAAEIAATLGITAGSLSVAAAILERKGYVSRIRDEADRRRVRLYLTPSGRRAAALHQLFHDELVEDVANNLTDEELKALVRGLASLKAFFQYRASR